MIYIGTKSPLAYFRWQYLVILLIGIAIGAYIMVKWPSQTTSAKVITVFSRGLRQETVTAASTVAEFLNEQGMLEAGLPEKTDIGASLVNGMQITYASPLEIILTDAGQSRSVITTAETVGEMLEQEGIVLAPSDIVSPDSDLPIYQKMIVVIERVSKALSKEQETIPFKTQIQGDTNLYYGAIEIVNPGKSGTAEVEYEVTYKNGNEIDRKIVSRTIINPPANRIEKHGRKLDVEATEYGRGSWYAYKGCLCAAHPFFPKGSFLRVTNQENGKSVIITVNDFGPNQTIHPDRLIDLDAEAFKLLAPLGQGTIQVKVEKLRTQ